MIVVEKEEKLINEANESDKRWKEGRPLSEIDGIPISMKDNFLVKGMETRAASIMLDGFVP
jgi:aspartyl-tRNA(Asn)/glutamyl-tRNA(Gln) amidotransferase subunit A